MMTSGVSGINLIPPEVRRAWKLKKIRIGLAVAATVYISAVAVVYIKQRLALSVKAQEVAALTMERDNELAKITGYADLTKKLGEIQKAEAELKKRLVATSALSGKRISWSAFLRRMSRDVPREVRLKAVSTSDTADGTGKKVRLAGASVTNKGVTDFIFALENNGYCRGVSLTYSQKRFDAGGATFAFEINAEVKLSDEIAYE